MGAFWVHPGCPSGRNNDLRLCYNAGTRAHKCMWNTTLTRQDTTRDGNQGSIHLRPDGQWQAKLDALKRVTQLTQTLAPSAVLLAGDFNSQFHVEQSAVIAFTKPSKGWEELGMEYVGKA